MRRGQHPGARRRRHRPHRRSRRGRAGQPPSPGALRRGGRPRGTAQGDCRRRQAAFGQRDRGHRADCGRRGSWQYRAAVRGRRRDRRRDGQFRDPVSPQRRGRLPRRAVDLRRLRGGRRQGDDHRAGANALPAVPVGRLSAAGEHAHLRHGRHPGAHCRRHCGHRGRRGDEDPQRRRWRPSQRASRSSIYGVAASARSTWPGFAGRSIARAASGASFPGCGAKGGAGRPCSAAATPCS